MPGNVAHPGATEAAALRRVKALELRRTGTPFRQVARELGVSLGQAHADVSEALRELAEAEKEAAIDLRQMEEDRLDYLWKKLEPKLEAGDCKAILAAVRLVERRSRLRGLDAPTQTEVGNLGDKPFKVYGPDVDPGAV